MLSSLIPLVREPDDWIDYRDIGSIFLNEKGFIPNDVMNDSLHPTMKGYELWAQVMESFFQDNLKNKKKCVR